MKKFYKNKKHDKFYQWMDLALKEAKQAYQEDEVPVGSVLIDENLEFLASAHNQSISLNDPSAHAEILALRKGAESKNNYRLPGNILISSLEPCIMCVGALVQARISGLIFAVRDPKNGAVVSKLDYKKDLSYLNHHLWIYEGLREEESRKLIQSFFANRRL